MVARAGALVACALTVPLSAVADGATATTADGRPVVARCFRLDNGREMLRHRHWFGRDAFHHEVPCTRAHLDAAKAAYEAGCVAGRYEEALFCALEREAMIWLEERLWRAAGDGRRR